MNYNFRKMKNDVKNTSIMHDVYIALAVLPDVLSYSKSSIENKIELIIENINNPKKSLKKESLDELVELMKYLSIDNFGNNDEKIKHKGKTHEFGVLYNIVVSINLLENILSKNLNSQLKQTTNNDIESMLNSFDIKNKVKVKKLKNNTINDIANEKYGVNKTIEILTTMLLKNKKPVQDIENIQPQAKPMAEQIQQPTQRSNSVKEQVPFNKEFAVQSSKNLSEEDKFMDAIFSNNVKSLSKEQKQDKQKERKTDIKLFTYLNKLWRKPDVEIEDDNKIMVCILLTAIEKAKIYNQNAIYLIIEGYTTYFKKYMGKTTSDEVIDRFDAFMDENKLECGKKFEKLRFSTIDFLKSIKSGERIISKDSNINDYIIMANDIIKQIYKDSSIKLEPNSPLEEEELKEILNNNKKIIIKPK